VTLLARKVINQGNWIEFAVSDIGIPLSDEVELDFSSSRFARVPVDGLGWAASSLPLSPPRQRLLSPGLLPDLDSNEDCDCWKIGRKKNAFAGPELPTVAARVAAKTAAAPWVGRMRM
jgi:hypothetical protein